MFFLKNSGGLNVAQLGCERWSSDSDVWANALRYLSAMRRNSDKVKQYSAHKLTRNHKNKPSQMNLREECFICYQTASRQRPFTVKLSSKVAWRLSKCWHFHLILSSLKTSRPHVGFKSCIQRLMNVTELGARGAIVCLRGQELNTNPMFLFRLHVSHECAVNIRCQTQFTSDKPSDWSDHRVFYHLCHDDFQLFSPLNINENETRVWLDGK